MKIYYSFFLIMCIAFTAKAQDSCQDHKKSSGAVLMSDPVGNNSRSDTIDIANYTIDIEVLNYMADQNIAAICTIDLKSKKDNITHIRFDLLNLSVNGVSDGDGNPLTYSYDNETLNVTLLTPLQTDDEMSIVVDYEGTPTVDGSNFGGFDFEGSYAYNLGVAFQDEPHNYGRSWFPCFDNFVERSTYEFHVTTDIGYLSYGNGLLMSSEMDVEAGQITRVWKITDEIPTYLASIAISDYEEVNWEFTSVSGATIPVVLAAREANIEDLQNSFVNLEASFNCFEEKFGPYRWEKIGYCTTPVGAMEHSGNIAYPINLVNGTTSGEEIMAHELAHHWFGNLITCRTAQDMWINEGLAEYLSYVFLECVYGDDNYYETIRNNHKNMIRNAHVNDNGYFPLSGMPINITYGSHTYNKGADVMHTLRSYMGDEAFFNGLKQLLADNEYQDIDAEGFKNQLSTISGIDLNDFFDNWIYDIGWSQFSIDNMSATEGDVMFAVTMDVKQRLKEANSFYNNVPVEVLFIDENLNEVTAEISLSGEETEAVAYIPFDPVFAAINTNEKISLATTGQNQIFNAPGALETDHANIKIDVVSNSTESFLRAEQHWVAPGGNYNDAIFYLSEDRYWSVKGVLSDDFAATATINFEGGSENKLDYPLMQNIDAGENVEENLVLLYRNSAQDEWQEYAFYITNSNGAAVNRSGKMELSQLLMGEYTFGVRKWSFGADEISENTKLSIYPNPGRNRIQIDLSALDNRDDLSIRISNSEGKTVFNKSHLPSKLKLKTNDWNNGLYIVQIYNQQHIIRYGKFIINK